MISLRGKEWFYKQCLREIKRFGPFTHLCWDILEKGIGQRDKARGQVTQAIGAVQGFLADHPEFIEVIKKSDATKPFDIASDHRMAASWIEWLTRRGGPYGRRAFGYNYTTLKGYLTPALGGTRKGGGGGDDEFKRVLRLMPEFIGSA